MRPLILLIGFIFSLSFSPIQLQGQKLTKALKVKVLSKKFANGGAKIKVGYQGMQFTIMLKKQDPAVNIRIVSNSGDILGKAKVSPTPSGGLKFKLIQSKEGLIPLWIFAYSNLINKGGKVLLARKTGGSQFDDCQFCCYKRHLDPYVSTSDAYVKKQIKDNKPPKEWGVIRYIPTESLDGFYECVQECMESLDADCN